MSSSIDVISVEVRDGIAIVSIHNPPVNATSQSVRAGLLEAISVAQDDRSVEAVVLVAEGRTFIAGGDIREFGKPPLAPGLPDVCNAIEASSKPVVAAVHGTTLGGGLEIALSCHGRVLASDASVGLPEVKLGLLPGAGGAQRLPRLIGLLSAIDMIATGRQVKADEALKLGIADHIVADGLREAATSLARDLVGKPLRRTGEIEVPSYNKADLSAAIATIARKARGQISPLRAAEVVELAVRLPLTDGLACERAAFVELMGNSQSRALRHTFFAEREVLRVPDLDVVTPRSVEHIAVIGAGTMGAGIAVALSDVGLPVTVVETSEAAVEAGSGRIDGTYSRLEKSGRITGADKAARLGRISFSTDFSALSQADFVIEAVFEDMIVKQDVFRRLGGVAKPGAVLATNTSYLDIEPIAEASGRPGDVIGLHFFAPANIMRLVEIIWCRGSAPDAMATGFALAAIEQDPGRLSHL